MCSVYKIWSNQICAWNVKRDIPRSSEHANHLEHESTAQSRYTKIPGPFCHISLQYAQHVKAVSPQSYIRLVIYSQRKHPYGLQTCYRQLWPLLTRTCCSRPHPGYIWFSYVNAISKLNSLNWRILTVILSEWANNKRAECLGLWGHVGWTWDFSQFSWLASWRCQ